jgi:hypothetical protein
LNKDKLAYGAKPVPPTLYSELAGLDEELVRQDKVMAQRRAEITAIQTRYETDKLRWRELRSDQKPPAAAAAIAPSTPGTQGAPPAPPKGSTTSSVTK